MESSNTADKRTELMLKYKERIIDGRAIAERLKGDLKKRIIQRQSSKLIVILKEIFIR